MSKPTDIRLAQVSYSQDRIDYRTPIKFGGRVVNNAVLLNVTVEVETRDGRRGQGFGSMPMGNVWAWPSQQVDSDMTLAALVAFGEQSAAVVSAEGTEAGS